MKPLLTILLLLIMGGCESIMEDDLIITEKRQHNFSGFDQKYRYEINHNAIFYSDKKFDVGDTLK